MQKKILFRVGGAALIVAMVAGSGIRHYSTAGPNTTVAQAAIQQQLESAIKESVQMVPTTAVPLSVNSALSTTTVSQMTATHNALLSQLFTANSPDVSEQKWGYNNELHAITYERNTAMTFSKFTYTSTSFINNNTTADVSFTALTSTTRQWRPLTTSAWETVRLPADWLGSATLQYNQGHWLISTLYLTTTASG